MYINRFFREVLFPQLKSISFLFLLVGCLNVFSQKVDKVALEASVDDYFQEDEFYQALEDLELLDNAYPNNPEYQYQIGVAYFHSMFTHRSFDYFLFAENSGFEDDKLLYYRGRTEHLHHNFNKALAYYGRYRRGLKKDVDEDVREELEDLIQQCHVGNVLKGNPLEIEIENIGGMINTKYPEYAPVMDSSESVLIFTSRRPDTKGGKKDYLTGTYYEDIYVARHDEFGKWLKPQSIGDEINTKLHDANVALSPDGKTLLTYKGRQHITAKLAGDLYACTLKSDGKSWSKPEKLPAPINSNDLEPSACFSSDGQTLYFSSNRPGGYGGIDIYVSEKEGVNWGEPKNLGPIINTDKDEDAPFIHADGKTLFFGSKGHTNIGGYDIFYSELDLSSGKWGIPENIGYPLNTADNDTYFLWSADATRGYFSSHRKDTYGDKDIYMMNRPGNKKDQVVLKGFVTDSISGMPVDAVITVTEHEHKTLVGQFPTDAKTGKYVIPVEQGHDYDLAIESGGYLFHAATVEVPKQTAYFEVTRNVNIEPYKKQTLLAMQAEEEDLDDPSVSKRAAVFEDFDPQSYNENVNLEPGDRIVFRDVYFDFDKAKLRPESKTALDEMYDVLRQQNQIIVEIAGYTDSIGRDNYNRRLSKKRAKAVAKYLVKKKGLTRKRLAAVGYGELNPRASNATDAGRQLNRRTEFQVVKMIDQKAYDEKNRVSLADFDQKEKQSQASANLFAGREYKVGESLPYQVHFPFGWETQLTDYSKGRLNLIVAEMKANSAMNLRIHSHADPLGASLEENRKVSDLRARTVRGYLMDAGVEPHRLEIASYGSERPLLRSNDIGENLVNRRVEFEVLD